MFHGLARARAGERKKRVLSGARVYDPQRLRLPQAFRTNGDVFESRRCCGSQSRAPPESNDTTKKQRGLTLQNLNLKLTP